MQEFNKKQKSTFTIMFVITASYLILSIVILFAMFDLDDMRNLKLNEWGDFFAGFFAPLVFFWLIFGYYQQGKELQIQGQELTNLVDIQKKEIESRDFSVQPFLSINKKYIKVDKEPFEDDDHNESFEDYIQIGFELLFQGGDAKFIEILEPVEKERLDGKYEIRANTPYETKFYLSDKLLTECVENKRVEFCIIISYFGIYGAKYSNIVNITVFNFDINTETAEIDLRLLGTNWS